MFAKKITSAKLFANAELPVTVCSEPVWWKRRQEQDEGNNIGKIFSSTEIPDILNCVGCPELHWSCCCDLEQELWHGLNENPTILADHSYKSSCRN